MGLAEERGDIGADRAGQVAHLGVRIAAQQLTVSGKILQPQRAQPAQQAALDQLAFLLAQRDAAMSQHELAQEIEIAVAQQRAAQARRGDFVGKIRGHASALLPAIGNTPPANRHDAPLIVVLLLTSLISPVPELDSFSLREKVAAAG